MTKVRLLNSLPWCLVGFLACTPPRVPPPATPAAPALTVASSPPPVTAEDLLSLEASPANSGLLADKPGELVVRLRIVGKARKVGERPPMNLALVVDTSGSMEGAAIDDARAASLALLDALALGDRLALVVFHSTTEVLMPSTVLTKETVASMRAKLGGIKASGTTDLAGGLAAGLREVQKSQEPRGVNRVVLLGDGVPNDPAPLAGIALSAGQRHISITALGLGLDYDETVMSRLALQSGGKYHFIQESSKVAKVFSDEVLRLSQVAGRGLVLTLTPGPQVVVKDVIGLPATRAGAKASVLLGDLEEGASRDVFVRLTVPARRAGSRVELLDAEVALEHPTSPGQRLTTRTFVSAKAVTGSTALKEGRDSGLEHAVARVSVADAIVRAVAEARSGDLSQARATLDAAEKEGRAAAKEFEDSDLAEKVKAIGPLRKTLPTLVPRHEAGDDLASGGAAKRPATRPRPAAELPTPASAAVVLKSQSEAMSTLQGQ